MGMGCSGGRNPGGGWVRMCMDGGGPGSGWVWGSGCSGVGGYGWVVEAQGVGG